jgi:hypothetical protein
MDRYPPLNNGRHTMTVELQPQALIDYNQEWFRDIGCPVVNGRYGPMFSGRYKTKNKTLWGSMHGSFPWLIERFPHEPSTDVQPGYVGADTADLSPVKGSGRGQSYYESMKETTDAVRRSRMRGNTHKRFHPDFLVPIPHAVDRSTFEACQRRGMNFLATEESQRLYELYVKASLYHQSDKTAKEDIMTLRLCDWFNALLKSMLGGSYKNLFHWTGTRQPAASTVIKQAVAWGKKDFTIQKEGKDKLDAASYSVDGAASGGETKTSSSKDMSLSDLLEQDLKTHVSPSGVTCSTFVFVMSDNRSTI